MRRPARISGPRFDKPIADLFDMQDEIASRLANRLGQELDGAEARRAARAANPDSMDHYFLGLAVYNKGTTPEHLGEARLHFDRALDLDPDNVDALVCRAWVDVASVGTHFSDDRAGQLRSADANLSKALKLRPDHANAHCALGAARMYNNRAV
jgi:hypothetical protein